MPRFQGKHELDTDAEMDLLEKIKLKHEQLEAERKVFEDLEFRTMEEEAQLEAEIEEVSMVMNNTQKELDTAETVVSEMELQKAEISINQDVSILQVTYFSNRYLQLKCKFKTFSPTKHQIVRKTFMRSFKKRY